MEKNLSAYRSKLPPLLVLSIGSIVTAVGVVNAFIHSELVFNGIRVLIGISLTVIGGSQLIGNTDKGVDADQVESAAAQSFWLLLAGLVVQLVFEPIVPSAALTVLILGGLTSVVVFYLL